MADLDLDLMVLGAGSGGVRAARMAAQLGARVAVAEVAATGGTCVNVGCIPKKLYSIAAHYAEDFAEAPGFGWPESAPKLDWGLLKSRRAAEISRLNRVYEGLLDGVGVKLLRGRARMAGPNEVIVDLAEGGQARVKARHVLVATGGHPIHLAIPGCERAVVSDQMFDLPEFPRRLVVVGAGYIACEMASIFHGLGAEVTQLIRGDGLLRGFDADIGRFLAGEMQKKGVELCFGRKPVAIGHSDDGLFVHVDDGSRIGADTVLMATGRGPNTHGLGLAEIGVKLRPNGSVIVDAAGASNLPSVHAVGDVTDAPQLTPVALAQAMVVVDRLFGDGRRSFDPTLIPTAVFTHPNVGTIGISEAAARERQHRVKIFRSEFRPLKHTLSGSDERSLMKLVVDGDSDKVLGLHMVGAEAGEIVQGFAVAMGMGATKAQFDSTLGIHPTMAEEFVTMRTPVAEA
ncbi:glutathione-disulfide reductase [Piscinibacter sakaiensis]|uniref:glutathione-disulfide reductase n=1 Tax=Piscinibacter sakaiensis TaxID=1547922 RepID=UPI003AADA3D0